MDWESAKKHCIERNWEWSLDLVNRAQKEMEKLESKIKSLETKDKSSSFKEN